MATDAPEIWIVLYLALWFLLPAGDERGRRGLLYGAAGGIVALIISGLIGVIWPVPRPFVVDPTKVHLLIHHAADASFPSDHVTGSFALALGLLWGRRGWGVVGFVIAVLVMWARVFVGVHWPADVVGGMVLGLAVTGLVLLARRQLEPITAFFLKNLPRPRPSSGTRSPL